MDLPLSGIEFGSRFASRGKTDPMPASLGYVLVAYTHSSETKLH